LGTCEICGAEREDLHIVIFEGRRVYACSLCIKKYSLVKVSSVHRKSTPIVRTKKQTVISRRPATLPIEEEYELVEDFGDKIKRAREKLGLTQSELATKMKIKVSLLKKIESGKLYPPIELAKKLEKLLGIELLEKVSEELKIERFKKEGKDYLRLGDFFPKGE